MNDELPPAIGMHGISKQFGNVVANDDVTFDARFGEVHGLIGENGAGKSTLMSILTGLYRPDTGEVRIAGQPVVLKSPADALDLGIGMVYQHFMLIEPFTVAENMVLGMNGGFVLDLDQVSRDINELGNRFNLEIDPGAKIWQISVGEQQRVEILRLLYRGARILILDEPTAVLTPGEADSLIATLREMAAAGYCIIFISHKLDEVLAVADRITVLRQGRTVATVDAETANRSQLARLMVDRELAPLVEHPDMEPEIAPVEWGPVVLAASGLSSKNAKGLEALRGIDLDIHQGEILGIAGVAGNGQSELAEVLTGLRRPTSGSIVVGGKEMSGEGPAEFAAAGVAHIPEDRMTDGLIGGMDLTSNTILRQYDDSPVAWGPLISQGAAEVLTDQIILDYAVQPNRRRARASALSGGNQQKLLLGRELATEPALIIAMHPTRGVDVGATEAIHQHFLRQRSNGTGILLISEDLDELIALADRILVMFDGQIVGEAPAHPIYRHQIGEWMAGLSGAGAHL